MSENRAKVLNVDGYCAVDKRYYEFLIAKVNALLTREAELLKIVNAQAGDEGLWFIAEHITEATLQKALRQLHDVIEGKQ